jgi:hypothetical protein
MIRNGSRREFAGIRKGYGSPPPTLPGLAGIGKRQVKLFSALLRGDGAIIAQIRIPDGTNETTQIKALLDHVDLTGAVVTADAAHASRETAECIAGQRGADYLLTAKGNTPGLQRVIYDKIQA